MAFFVLSEYSGVTAKKTLWEVHSRRFATRLQATDWMDFCIAEDKTNKRRRKREFFVVEVPDGSMSWAPARDPEATVENP